MAIQKMKVKDLIKMEVDVDVYDNYTEELAIAFCGTVELTEEGKKHFAHVLDFDVELDEKNGTAIIDVEDDSDKQTEENLSDATEFFYASAGWCSDKKYEKLFVTNSDSAFLL